MGAFFYSWLSLLYPTPTPCKNKTGNKYRDIMEMMMIISAWYMNMRLKYFQQIMLSTFGPESFELWAFVSAFLHTRRMIVVIPNDRIL